MGVNPGFRIIDDVQGANAFAMDRTLISNTRGTVLFGINLITDEFTVRNGGYAIAGIGAHECAHIFQYFSSYGPRLAGNGSAKYMELHADYLAGYYMAKKMGSERNLEIFASSLFSKGDFDFNDPAHHGTPDERVSAMKQGFEVAKYASFVEAAEQGARYVEQA